MSVKKKPDPSFGFRKVAIDVFEREFLPNFDRAACNTEGRSARIYKTSTSIAGTKRKRGEAAARAPEHPLYPEACVLKVQLLVLCGSKLRSVQFFENERMRDDESERDYTKRCRIINDIFHGRAAKHADHFDMFRELSTHEFAGEVKALRRAVESEITPPLHDAFLVKTDSDSMYLGCTVQSLGRPFIEVYEKVGIVQPLVDERNWGGLLIQMQAMARAGLAHLDINPGNLLVRRGHERPIQLIDFADALRPSHHFPFHDQVTKSDRDKLGALWRYLLMAIHLKRMWNTKSMKSLDGFTDILLPRMHKLVQKLSEKYLQAARQFLVPGTDAHALCDVFLYD